MFKYKYKKGSQIAKADVQSYLLDSQCWSVPPDPSRAREQGI